MTTNDIDAIRTHPLAAACHHQAKARLLGYDARLWQCAGSVGLGDKGCGQHFVEGRTRRGEPDWLPLGVTSRFDICCGNCLDGFCTSVDDMPCQACGRSSARSGVSR